MLLRCGGKIDILLLDWFLSRFESRSTLWRASEWLADTHGFVNRSRKACKIAAPRRQGGNGINQFFKVRIYASVGASESFNHSNWDGKGHLIQLRQWLKVHTQSLWHKEHIINYRRRRLRNPRDFVIPRFVHFFHYFSFFFSFLQIWHMVMVFPRQTYCFRLRHLSKILE